MSLFLQTLQHIPVTDHFYLFHLTGLLTVLTSGIFTTAAKTQKEIQ